jgi:ATP-dependent helicase YprA (DUF1998 family)
MAERAPIEIVRSLARQRGRHEPDPLTLTHALETRSGERISHLPVSHMLSQVWVTLTGAPFRPHQALALSALRRGEPFALAGGSAATHQTLHLLLHDELLNDPQASALLLAPTRALARQHRAELRHFGEHVPTPLRVALVEPDTRARDALRAQVLIATPDMLHYRLLRHYDRAWQRFWARLRYVWLADADHYHGVAAAHLAGLLLRCTRLIPSGEPPLLAANLAAVQKADLALFRLSGLSWRIIAVNDTPHPPATLAVWRAGHRRLHDSATLALTLLREGYQVHIICDDAEKPLLLELLDQDQGQVGVGPIPRAAQVHIFAGYPGAHTPLHQSVTSGAALTLLVLGNLPVERSLARLNDALLNEPPPVWTPAPTNAYISAQHLLCAAAERPLSRAEVAAWHAQDIVDHLQRLNQMVELPDEYATWQPLPSAEDPYEGFGIHAVGSVAIQLFDEYGQYISTLDPVAFDRWGYSDAALPPGRGGYRVLERDESAGKLIVRVERQQRRTLALRYCEVTMHERDERARRILHGRAIGWGRVLIDEEIRGYRETQPDSAPADYKLTPPLATRWTAPALWIDLPMHLNDSGQLVGWSLVAVMSLRVLAHLTDLVPAYDAERRRLYIVDAHPGGSGLAVWLYENLETILPLAYDVALDCHNDALLEPAARQDMDWLLALLGGEFAVPAPAHVAASGTGQQASGSSPASAHQGRTPPPAGPSAAPGPAARPPEPEAPAPPATAPDKPATPGKAAHPDAASTADKPAAPEAKSARSSRKKPRKEAREAAPSEDSAEAAQANPAANKRKSRARTKKDAPPGDTEAPAAKADQDAPGKQEPPAPPAVPPPSTPEGAPPGGPAHRIDPNAILEKLRQQRQQHEADAPPASKPSSAAQTNARPRFQVGERVFCLPYGEGVVRGSRFEDGSELLTIEFAEHGPLDIKPSVSMVRRLDPPPDSRDDSA